MKDLEMEQKQDSKPTKIPRIKEQTVIAIVIFSPSNRRGEMLTAYSKKFEEQIKAVVSTQFSHETIDMVYPNGDSTVIAFSNDEVIYQGTYEVVTKEGNNYTYPLEFTLKKGDDGVIVNDIKVGG